MQQAADAAVSPSNNTSAPEEAATAAAPVLEIVGAVHECCC
jgi:hypothetical protein